MSVSRVACCFICSASTRDANTISLIQDTSNLQSGKKLLDIVSEIAEKPLKEEDIHSTVLCKKCSQTCKEYDDLQVRLKLIKTELHGQINKNNESPTKPEAKKVVLPASKLHPLPPDFVLNVGRLPGVQKVTTIPSKLSLKVTVGTSVLTQSIKTTSALAKNIVIQKTLPKTEPQPQSEDLVFEETKDFISSVVLQRIEDGNNDDHPMEIDEDCSYAIVTQEDGTSEVREKKSGEQSSSYVLQKSGDQSMFDVSLLSSLEDSGGENEAEASTDQYIVGKLEILSEREDEDDEEQTIVMSEENSIFRVVSGQKLVYSESGLELLSEDADTQADSQDDEDSQIELQVSGDEETANAIIAAAREQGGAFIKVQSGEMYRVKSVQSKPKEEEETDFTDHLQIVVKEDGVFNCVLCRKNKAKGARTGRCAGDAEFIMRHMRSQHAARVYICRTCGRVLRRRDHYIAHVAKHAKENSSTDKSKFHECDTCHKKYSSKTLLVEHMNLHNGQRPYTCHICHKSFASKYTHQSHLKTHLDRPRPFKCAACGKCFFTLQNLNQHHKTHSGLKEFECNICGKAFGTQHNLEMHGVVHSGQKPFVCGVCGKAFARRAEVKDHMRIHTGERPFACDVCGATFSQRSNLHSHKRATHYDDKRYKCDQCPKRFKRRRLLDYHIKASHTGERPLKCEICKATFVYPEHYKKHARIHSGEKPYVCEVCGKSFNSRDNRNTHRFVHSDKKPYECLVCGAGYMRKRLLYSHMNTQGHLAESIVVNQPRVTIQRVAGAAPADNVYESTEELELESEGTAKDGESQGAVYIGDKKYILQGGKTSLNLVQETDDILTYNLEGALKTESNFLEAVTAEQLGEVESQLSGDGGGAVRVVQITLPDGNNGWVAINP
ncbi:zinc finger and BTB domain-containing protein 17-like [Leguminivora glycinivorella]|uniref:zinc finger and BTB domain-containing protein 17-like n=1 Tax=Leguminivora glycinivorella TaxID=1035111 RepID=UPI0020102EB7|nr:zinc finger and BTB domain-containing protein 17-like [Leguminivora glycinivorella]